MKSISKMYITLLFLYLICFLNCYSIKYNNKLTANNLSYPVSTNEFIHNKSLKVINQNGYTVIDHFSFKIKRYYLSFGGPISSKEVDLSNKINSLVKKKGGDGVVNFALFYNQKYGGKYNYAVPLPYILLLFQLGTPCYYLYNSKTNGFLKNFLGYIAGIWITTLTIEYFFPKVYTIDAEGDIVKFR